MVIPLIAGWVGGWVVNYLADVLPVTRRFSQPACPQCDASQHWQDYLLFRACRSCGKRRSIRTWIVQLFLVAMSLTIWILTASPTGLHPGDDRPVVLYHGLCDRPGTPPDPAPHQHLRRRPGTGGRHSPAGTSRPRSSAARLDFVIVFMFYLFGLLFTRIRSRRLQSAGMEADDEEAFGAGDVILATILGFVLGWPLIWFGILFGVLLGGIIGGLVMLVLFLSRRFKSWMVFIPFGPFFITSAFLILYLPQFVRFLVPK